MKSLSAAVCALVLIAVITDQAKAYRPAYHRPAYYKKSPECNSRYPYCVWSRVQGKYMCHDWVERPGVSWSEHNGVECTKPRRANSAMLDEMMVDESSLWGETERKALGVVGRTQRHQQRGVCGNI